MTAHDVRQEITAEGPAEPFRLLVAQLPFAVSFRVTVPAGVDAVYGVEYTLDDPTAPDADWIDDDEVGPGSETSDGGAYHAPVRALRVNIEALAPGGRIFFTVLQGTR